MSESNADDLIWSIKNGDLEAVTKFVDSPKIVNELIKGRSYLHYACDYGEKEIIEYLLSKGANINLQDKYQITPLLAAIWENHEDCVKLLIQKGANKQCKSPDGKALAECTENDKIKAMLK